MGKKFKLSSQVKKKQQQQQKTENNNGMVWVKSLKPQLNLCIYYYKL